MAASEPFSAGQLQLNGSACNRLDHYTLPSLPGLTRQSGARGRKLMSGWKGAMDARIKSGHDERKQG